MEVTELIVDRGKVTGLPKHFFEMCDEVVQRMSEWAVLVPNGVCLLKSAA